MKKYLCVLAALVLSGCASELMGDPAESDRIGFSVGMAKHPNGKYLYVVNSNFDLEYRVKDGGSIAVISLESGKVVEGASKRIGSFGTSIVLSQDGKRGYAITRSDDRLVWFAISDDGSKIYCPNKPEAGDLLACRIRLEEDPSHMAYARTYREWEENGEKKREDFDLLMISHLAFSRVTAVTIKGEGEKPVFSSKFAGMIPGASEILHFEGEKFLFNGRASSFVNIISPALTNNGEVLGLTSLSKIKIAVGSGFVSGRGMAFDKDSSTLYMLNHYPESVLAISLAGESDNSKGNSRLISHELLPRNPYKIQLHKKGDKSYLYISAFKDDALLVLDPDTLSILKQVDVGDGPYDFILDKQKDRLLLNHFRSNDIWELDIGDPLNPRKIRSMENNPKQ